MTILSLEDEKKRIKAKAYRYLAGRAHSEKELQTKLEQKGFSRSLIKEVLQEFKEKKFLDDAEFALSFARSRILTKPMGERLLRQELRRKGLSNELIESTVRQVYSEKSEAELAESAADKRITQYKNLEMAKRRKRLNDFLVRRGFAWELIREIITRKIKS